ncbi:MAG: Stealth CR1 domain-containing protein [Muribaculaceae bacterium]|nr:Stealth CR1 domain-containing protein [Muribaculaceae bacterium]
MEKIDFVITWVDNNDPLWQEEFHKYLPESNYSDDIREIRYRNWDNLRYLFRGIEKYAPWVNRVHLVTCGQIPEWLNMNAPKLNFIKHSDYIPEEYLPTFSSRPIILNLHRIKELSEHFVLFDDDCFVIGNVAPERFFRKGLPCDLAAFNALSPSSNFTHNVVNDISIINVSFKKYEMLRKHFWKWFSFHAGNKLYRTIVLSPWPHFQGFYDHHLPQIFLKSTLVELWEKYEDILHRTSSSRFRSITDVNSWLIRYWQLAKGNFVPLNLLRDSVCLNMTDKQLDKIVKTIVCKKKKIICLNDSNVSSFETAKERINAAFKKILPEKSSFEK